MNCCTAPEPGTVIEGRKGNIDEKTTRTAQKLYFFPFLMTSIDAVPDDSKGTPSDRYKLNDEAAVNVKEPAYIKFDGTHHSDVDTTMEFIMDAYVEDPGSLITDPADSKHEHKFVKVYGVSVDERHFKNELNKLAKNEHQGRVLIVCHGFTVEPACWMKVCDEKMNKSSVKTFKVDANPAIVPVVWPTENAAITYRRAKDLSKAAGKIFGEKMKYLDKDSDINLSVMCHSMGNRTLLKAVQQFGDDGKHEIFDHVFMIAADVWEEVFNERVITNSLPWRWYLVNTNEWLKAGLKLARSMKRTGASNSIEEKIHIYYYRNDKALDYSDTVNFRDRLGAFGTLRDERLKVNEECKQVIRNVNLQTHLEHKVKEVDPAHWHSYQFMDHILNDIGHCMVTGYKDGKYKHDLENIEVEMIASTQE